MDLDEIKNGAQKALIDKNHLSSLDLKPSLIFNNDSNKVLYTIKEQLSTCDEFKFSIAFITKSGIQPLKAIFLDLEEKNIPGKILTTDYMFYTDPEAIKFLNKHKNIEVRIYTDKFHTKGYLFKKNGIYTGIVGSSNLTDYALNITKEWNIGFTSTFEGELLNDLNKEFNELWESEKTLSVDEYIGEYEKLFKMHKTPKKFKALRDEYIENTSEEFKPNKMQKKFLDRLTEFICERKEKKAILVSATGTGKTYASAFAVKKFKAKKFLFLVHRAQIAKQAKETYEKVFKDENLTFGILGGGTRQLHCDFIFSTFQSMNSNNRYELFDKNEFDFIVVDEVHRAAADTYSKIISYFEPEFLLGMSATPWRNDNKSKELFKLFDNNIVYQISLQDALGEDLLCPFHYYGISDLRINDDLISDEFNLPSNLNKKEKDFLVNGEGNSEFKNLTEVNIEKFKYLTSDERVKHILEKSKYYGYSGSRVKALVFCSSIIEAKVLSKKFNEKNHPSIALDSSNSPNEREDAIDRLINDDIENKLEYIFTYDIFNEGVDIREVNQIILIRPTQSSIVFVQQFGRGLRKSKEKEFVVILDFIGNYKKNYMIPIALSGMKNYNKDDLREFIISGDKLIPGLSSISFDQISKKQIFKSIDESKFYQRTDLKEKYNTLKSLIGKQPTLCDIQESEEFDAELIFKHKDFSCYHSFLKYADNEYTTELDDDKIISLKFISKKLSNGIRPHELLILKSLIYSGSFSVPKINRILLQDYNLTNQLDSINSSINYLNFNFFKKDSQHFKEEILVFMENKENLNNLFFIKSNDDNYIISDYFKECLINTHYKEHILDLIEFSLNNYDKKYKSFNPLKIGQKYRKEDIFKLLGWDNYKMNLKQRGYPTKNQIVNDNCPIFVTYEKSEDISESTKYEDYFINPKCFNWMTQSNNKIDSKDLEHFNNSENNNVNFYLFIKKSSKDKDFYYLGQVTPKYPKETTILNDNGKSLPIVNYKLELDEPVERNLYDYFETILYDD